MSVSTFFVVNVLLKVECLAGRGSLGGGEGFHGKGSSLFLTGPIRAHRHEPKRVKKLSEKLPASSTWSSSSSSTVFLSSTAAHAGVCASATCRKLALTTS